MSRTAGSGVMLIGTHFRLLDRQARARLFDVEPDPSRLLAAAKAAGLKPAVVIATCERYELIFPESAERRALAERLLAEWSGLQGEALEAVLYEHRGGDLARHLAAVAASLESVVLGEPEVLGQVREAYRLAEEAGTLDGDLEALFQFAFKAGRRVRSETAIGQQSVSVVAAGLQTARDLHGDLADCRALLLGLGELTEVFARHLIEAGIGDLVFCHPNDARAEAAARRHGRHHRPWSELDAALAEAELIVTGLAEHRFTVTPEALERALKRRRHRPILVIDAAVPGDIDPAAGELDDIFLFELADLERIAAQGAAAREAARDEAWAIIDDQLQRFEDEGLERQAAPAVAALRAHFEAEREAILAEGLSDPAEATRRLIARLLHRPSAALREATRDPEARARLEQAAERLFAPDGSATPDDGKEQDE